MESDVRYVSVKERIPEDFYDLRAYLDGEDVSDRCSECLAGEPGWVRLYRVDDNGDKIVLKGIVLEEIIEGHVVIKRRKE